MSAHIYADVEDLIAASATIIMTGFNTVTVQHGDVEILASITNYQNLHDGSEQVDVEFSGMRNFDLYCNFLRNLGVFFRYVP